MWDGAKQGYCYHPIIYLFILNQIIVIVNVVECLKNKFLLLLVAICPEDFAVVENLPTLTKL